MSTSSRGPQESLSFGEAAVAGTALIGFLAIAVPLLGTLMAPVAVLVGVVRVAASQLTAPGRARALPLSSRSW